MNKFKVDDRVQYNAGAGNNANYSRLGLTGTITGFSDRGVFVLWSDGQWKNHSPQYLVPAFETQDDPLPPAPESVKYVGLPGLLHPARTLRMEVLPNLELLDINVGGGDGLSKSLLLDPDSALQLCHDIRRMAMELKRKQKQEVE